MKRLAICLGLTHVDPAAYDGWDGDCPGCDRDAARCATALHDRGFDGEIVDDVVASYLCKLPPGVRVLFVSDCCHAEDNFKARPKSPSYGALIGAVMLGPKATESFGGSLIQFAGCAQDRSSYGADDGGAWTIAWLDTLKKARKPLTYRQWFDRAASRMSKKQKPVLVIWGEPDFLDREALT